MSAIGLEHADVRQNRLLALLRQQPLICYFVIAYAFTWTYDLLFLVLFPLPDVLGRSAPRDLGPSVAAIIMTAAVAGKPGLKRLGQRLVLWRVNAVATRGRLGYVRPGDDAGRVPGAVVGQ